MKLPLHIEEYKSKEVGFGVMYEIIDADGLYQFETPLRTVAEEIVEIVNKKGCCYCDCKRND